MIEANVEIYRERANALKAAAVAERTVIDNFITARTVMISVGSDLTGTQKAAALGALTDARTEREIAVTAVDEAFSASDPL